MPAIGFTFAGMLGFLGMLALLRLVKWNNLLTFKSDLMQRIHVLFSFLFLLSFERHHVQWSPSLHMSCMMRLLALQLPILLQLVQLWVVLGRLAKPMDVVASDASDASNASMANATVEEASNPGTLGQIETQGILSNASLDFDDLLAMSPPWQSEIT